MLRVCGRYTLSSRPLLASLHQLAARLFPVEGSSRCASNTTLQASAQALSRRGAPSVRSAAPHPVASLLRHGENAETAAVALSKRFPNGARSHSRSVSAPLASLASHTDDKEAVSSNAVDVQLHDSDAGSMDLAMKLERPVTKRRRVKLDPLVFAEQLKEKVQLLETEGLSSEQMGPLLKKRAFVACSPEQLFARLRLLRLVVGGNACRIVAANAGLLQAPIEHLEKTLTLFQTYGIPNEVLLKVGTSHGSLLTAKPEHIHARLHCLEEIGFTVEERNRVLIYYPHFLRLSVESKIKPVVEFLKSKARSEEKLLQHLSRRPHVLALSLEKHLLPSFKLFEKLGCTFTECWKAGINCKTSVEGLLSLLRSLGFTDAGIMKMIKNHPQVLRQSSASLKERLHLLTDTYERDLEEIVRLPATLSYSLEKRVLPRLKILREKNLDKEYSLASILPVKESVFRKRFGIPDSVAFG